MTTRPRKVIVELLIAGGLFAAMVAGAIALLGIDWSGEGGSGLSDSFKYDLQKYQNIDPSLFRYHSVAALPIDLSEPRAIAVGIDDQILIAGDKAVDIFSPLPWEAGQRSVAADPVPVAFEARKKIVFDVEPYCLTVGNAEHAFPGRIYVGMRDHVEVFAPDGMRLAVWPAMGMLTSLTTSEKEVFLADAKARIVRQCDVEGKPIAQIDGRIAGRSSPGFVVPSPYFDVAMSPDGLLRVVNPGAHRIDAYTLDGQLELSWGRASEQIDGFCGCCNPSHIAVLPDGRIVTSEKGIPRVKVYSATGEFEGVVAGPETLSPNPSAPVETRDELRLHPADVATDSHGRIFVLDAAARCVHVFVENQHE